MSGKRVIVITGPTATGKTKLAVQLAESVNGEVVSADSMQVYKQLNIGTAKPAEAEKRGITHHMIDIVPPWEDYSVARYVREATACVDDIFQRGRQPILVGGTGLYIDSLLAGREFSARGKTELRRTLEEEYDSVGGEAMLLKLQEVDKESAGKLHTNDKKRIVRALEAYMSTGKPISLHDFETKAIPPKYDSVIFALTYMDRSTLYERINFRVDKMMSMGLEWEVVSLLEMGVSRSSTSMQAIGYKEISEALFNKTDISEAIEKIKMESRRYAKRQLTWLRRNDKIKWITYENVPDIDTGVKKILNHSRRQQKHRRNLPESERNCRENEAK
jgi:tRNA dimethylallyltransferase